MTKTVCLCGSTRFKETFHDVYARETLDGNIVHSVGVFGHSDGVMWTPEKKKEMDDLHKKKILLSDEIVVINVGGYMGDSTKSEIKYALDNNKAVRFLEPDKVPDWVIYYDTHRDM